MIVELAFHPQTRNGLSVIHLAFQCTCSVSSVMTGFLPENRSSEPSAAPAVEGSARNPFLFRKCLPSAHICRRTDISRAPPSTRSVGISLGLQCGSLHAGPCARSGPLSCAWQPFCRCCSTLG